MDNNPDNGSCFCLSWESTKTLDCLHFCADRGITSGHELSVEEDLLDFKKYLVGTVVCWFCAMENIVARKFHYSWGCRCLIMDRRDQQKGSQYLYHLSSCFIKLKQLSLAQTLVSGKQCVEMHLSTCRADTVEQNIHKLMQLPFFQGCLVASAEWQPNSLKIHSWTII